MAVLLGPNGRPIDTQNKKATPPKLGESFGNWAGRDNQELLRLPGGGLVQFNLDNLEMSDYRQMLDHYQINASFTLLTFMMHQLEWRIECKEQKIADHVSANMEDIWGRLVRAKSQAFWAGYSPNVLEWENDLDGKTVQLNKIKDLLPEECEVKWKIVEGWAPRGKPGPKLKVYDGIRQLGEPYPVPVRNSYWYPLLMQNGDYQGKKLLRPAFQSWFFSLLLHLFANRYYERFGEPLPIGRAPYDDTVPMTNASGQTQNVPGNVLMENVISQIRNRSVVVLPNDKSIGSENQLDFDYQLEYLESQMRGADFERYMTRLDEEMSLALFTPLLMMRTGDVGSYSLGEQHTKTWLWMLNALAADWVEYINKYIISPMIDFNFSPKAPRAKIVFRKMGKTDAETVRALITALFNKDKATPDLHELGQIAGLTLKEMRVVTTPEADEPNEGPNAPGASPSDDPTTAPESNRIKISVRKPSVLEDTLKAICERLLPQVKNAFRDGTFVAGFAPSLGHKRRLTEALRLAGHENATDLADRFYQIADGWIESVASIGTDEFETAEAVVEMFDVMMDTTLERLTHEES